MIGSTCYFFDSEVQSGKLSELENLPSVVLSRDTKLVFRVISRYQHVALLSHYSRTVHGTRDILDFELIQVKAIIDWRFRLIGIHV